jgi:hypothetical protein
MATSRKQLAIWEDSELAEFNPLRLDPGSGAEGIWKAYEEIPQRGWLTQNSQVIVITDGCIEDKAPNMPKANGEGVYPLGVYRGDPEHLMGNRKYFSRFIVRPNFGDMLSELTGLL